MGALEADGKEPLVEVGLDGGVRALDVFRADRRLRCDLPDVAAVLLQEVRVGLAQLEDPLDRRTLVLDSLLASGKDQGVGSGRLAEAADPRESEKSLRIRLRLAGQPGDRGQPPAHQRERQLALGDPVQGRDQRLEAPLVEELDLVEQEDDSRAGVFGRLPQLDQELAQVFLQIAGVGRAGERVTSIESSKPSGVLTEKALSTPSARRARSLARSALLIASSTRRDMRAISGRSSVSWRISLSAGNQPRPRAMSSNVVSSTVLPTPRRPVISMLRSGLPRSSRPSSPARSARAVRHAR